MTGIYQIFNKVTGKRYIGQATDYSSRKREHTYDLRHKRHYNKYLQAAWNKYGEQAFEFSLLEECPKEKLNEREMYYIALYDVTNHDKGYNFCRGGEGFKGHQTEEARAKISKTLKGRKKPEGFGKHLSEMRKGKVPIETRKTISNAVKDWWKTTTPEQIRNRIEGIKRSWYTPENVAERERLKKLKLLQTAWSSLPESQQQRWQFSILINLSNEEQEEIFALARKHKEEQTHANRVAAGVESWKNRPHSPLSAEHKRKISISLTGKPKVVDTSPEATAKRSATQKRVMQNETLRQNLREKAAAYYADPTNRQKHLDACAAARERKKLKVRGSNPEEVEKQLTND